MYCTKLFQKVPFFSADSSAAAQCLRFGWAACQIWAACGPSIEMEGSEGDRTADF